MGADTLPKKYAVVKPRPEFRMDEAQLGCEYRRCGGARSDVRDAGHLHFRFNFVAVQDGSQIHQHGRSARWAACRRVSNAIAILAKVSGFQRYVLQHWGIHVFTYLMITGLATDQLS